MIRILPVLFCIGFLFLAFRFLEGRMIFFPLKEMAASPRLLGLSFEDVLFETADRQKLHGWFLPAGEDRITVLFCHGNAGNISHRLEKASFFHRLGYNLFLFDYRGYGQSGGWPSEQGFYKDAQAAYDHLRERGIPADRIAGYGESIGGAVLADLALERPVKALVLENTFTSIPDMARIHYPWVPSWALANRFDAGQKIARVTVPKLILQSENDEIVPARLGTALFKAAAPPKGFLAIRGGHNESFFESEELIGKKIRELLGD